MTLRSPLLAGVKALSLVVSLALPPAPASANPDVAAQVSQQLSSQGYGRIEVRRTLLGKVVVIAHGHGHQREIVIDPRNGALLRDLIRQEDGQQNGVSIARVGEPDDGDGKDDGEGDDGKDGDNSGPDDDGGDDDSDSGGDDSDSDDSDDDSGDDDSGDDDGGDDDSGDDDGGDDSDREDD
ncbi:MAG: hypothetical protein ACK5IP_21360 [Paracoccus sp. (in: a-proteobacteria)]